MIPRVGIHPLVITPSAPGAKLQMVRQQLFNTMRVFLAGAAVKASKAAKKRANQLMKISDKEKEAIIEAIAVAAFAAIPWENLIESLVKELQAAAETGSVDGIIQLEITEDEATSIVNTIAADYAKERAAEMIGKRLVDGVLVDNPNAEWVISNTTRDDLRDIIEAAFQRQSSVDEIEQLVRDAGTFSKARAEMIAKTEIALAQIKSNMDVWRRTGMVKSVNVVLSSLHDVEDECDDLVAGNPYPIGRAPSLPAHPLCRCGFEANELVEV